MRQIVILAAVVVSALFQHVVNANVMGIDLGSEFIKIASIRPRTGIDIVLNEQSRRKTFQFIGFRGEDRYIGEDAKNLSPRFPFNMISMLNRIVGISYDDVTTREWFTNELLHTYDLIPNERRKTIDIRIQNNPTKVFDVETLLGIIFAYLRVITKEHNDGFEITDAVLVIPSFFTARQRRSLIDAARLGGIAILGMMNTTTAIALQYGIQNRGFSKPVDIVIYDMGTSRTEIGVYTITPPPKGAKKAESLGTITTKFLASDPYLGGRNFDACLARKVASGIPGVDVMSESTETNTGAKHAVILMRAANKAREVLSANKDTLITFEGVLPNQMDYTTKVKREEFESWCAPLFQRAMELVRRAFEAVSTPPTDLHAFEIHGGAVRMPKFLEEMQQLLTRPVNRTLNGDESAALGAAYYAARLSGAFVVRGFAVHEVHPQNVTFHLSPPPIPLAPLQQEDTTPSRSIDTAEAPETPISEEIPPQEEILDGKMAPIRTTQPRSLFVNATLPRRRRITVTRSENFNITLFSNDEWDSELRILDLPSVLLDLGFAKPEKDANNTHAVRLEMRLNESGLIEMEHAKAKYNEWVNVTKRIKVPVNETSTTEDDEAATDSLKSASIPTSSEEPATRAEHSEGPTKQSQDANDSQTESNTSPLNESQSDMNQDATSSGQHEADQTLEGDSTANDAQAKDEAKKPKFEYREVQEKKQKHHQKKLNVEIVYRDPQPMNQKEFESADAILKEMNAVEARKRETASAKNDLESMIIGVLADYLDQYTNYITSEETEVIQTAARHAREWLEDGDGANDETTKSQYLEQLGMINSAMQPVINKKREHLEAIEKAKRDAIKEALKAEKARREAEKKIQEETLSESPEDHITNTVDEPADEGKNEESLSDEEHPATDPATEKREENYTSEL